MTGTIMVCRGRRITLYSLNGDLFFDQNICDSNEDSIVSCAFYEGAGNEWLERELLFTGHKRGLVNVSFFFPLMFEGHQSDSLTTGW